MARLFKCLLFFVTLFSGPVIFCQNETSKWYFAQAAALDFATTIPLPINNSTMYAAEGSASVADASGNLLFYTNGATVWNASHVFMTNGTGLLGIGACAQPALIVKKPGSGTIYYLFTLNVNSTTPGFYYSEIDMSLSGGMGAVTNKNVPLYLGKVGVKLSGTRHCNGTDFWVVMRDWGITGISNFRSYKVTSSGVDTNAIVSNAFVSANAVGSLDYGCMKVSPNGKKLAAAVSYYWNFPMLGNHAIELYDFDNVTGAVSNSMALAVNTTTTTFSYGYGVEFSPDGTKLFATKMNNNQLNYGCLCQFDLCAGTPTAIAASIYTVASFNTNNYWGHGSLQLGKNGKIYAANWSLSNTTHSISVINNPNLLGAACGYSHDAQSVGTGSCVYGLPNFMGSYFLRIPDAPPFSYTVSNNYGCQSVFFKASNLCPAAGYSLQSMIWDFGDPASGSLNTSSIPNPIHKYSSLGTYTAQLIVNYTCGGGSDTVKQVINVNQPCISIVTSSVSCAGLGSGTVFTNGGIGPFSFTWMPANQTGSVATALTPGPYTVVVNDANTNTTYSQEFILAPSAPFSGNLVYQPTVSCYGAQTATAAITNITGGSSSQSYTWTDGSSSYTNAVPNLGAGNWTVTVLDNISGCSITNSFLITQPSSLGLTLTASSPTACAGKAITLHGVLAGGVAPYTFTWSAGPLSDTYFVSTNQGGNYSYILTGRDSLQCQIRDTISVAFISNPALVVSSTTICANQTATLHASGASSYVWSDNSTSSTFTDNPSSSGSYWVIGSALGCTSTATALIFVKPLPVPSFTCNSPLCEGQNLDFLISGGTTYYWEGPNNFTSVSASPSISAASPSMSGQYDFTVTGTNACVASGSVDVIVNPTPTVTALGGTVCSTQTLTLFANAGPGMSFLWSGPQSFSSTAQNPIIINPSIGLNGSYVVTALSASGCSNTAVADASITSAPVVTLATNSPLCENEDLTLHSTINASLFSIDWKGPNNFSSQLPDPTINKITLQNAGDYTLNVSSGPCIVSIIGNVIVNTLPQPIINGPDNVCEGTSFSLNVSDASHQVVSYSWQYPLGGSNQQNVLVDTVRMSNGGIYSAALTDVNGCTGISSKTVNVLINPTVTALGDTVCLGASASLMAFGADSYFWSGKNLSMYAGPVGIVSAADYINPETYSVVGMAVNGCTAAAIAQVLTSELPKPGIVVQPKNRFCLNEEVEFSGTGGMYYVWVTPEGVNHEGQHVRIPLKNIQMAGQFTLMVTDAFGCRNFTVATIIIDPAPDGVLTGNNWNGCAPFCAEYKFQQGSAFPKSYAEFYSGQLFLGRDGFKKCFTAPGEYIISGRVADSVTGCVSTQTYLVNARNKPYASFTWEPEKPVEIFDEVRFTNSSMGDFQTSWTWHIQGQTDAVKAEVCHQTFQESGTYLVAFEVGNKWGCVDTVIKAIEIAPDFSFYMPNAFTPGEDGRNDAFAPVGRGIKDFRLQVFDRWGERIYSGDDLHLGWDGTFKGQPCKTDTYVWKVTLSTTRGEQKAYQGHVVLIR